MYPMTAISIDLTAQELTDPPIVGPIEVDDILEFDPLLNPRTATNVDDAGADGASQPGAQDDTVEIELTAEQMDAMLCWRPLG